MRKTLNISKEALQKIVQNQNLLNLQIHQMKMVWTKNYFLNKSRFLS